MTATITGHGEKHLVDLEFVGTGSGGGGPPADITATDEHPFWVVGRGWTDAADLQTVIDDLVNQGYEVRTEVSFPTPGGFKNVRAADVVAYDSSGAMVLVHQIGRQTSGGIPVTRETKAMSDIWSVLDDGVDILFHPYN